MKFSEIFNNREVASGIWLIIIFFFMLIKSEIRKSLVSVFKAFFKIKILVHFFLMIVYLGLCILLLEYFNFWTIILLKDAIFWFLLTALVLTSNAITNNGKDKIFKSIFIKSIQVIVVIQFIANSYTFSLITEIIVLPIILIVVGLEVYSENKEAYQQVNKLMNFILFSFGVAILINAVYLITINFNKFGSYLTLKKFLFPIILTILYLPFLFFSVIISNYEQLFLRVSLSQADLKVKRYARKILLFYCKFNLNKINLALNMSNYNVMSIKSNDDVDDMINKYKTIL